MNVKICLLKKSKPMSCCPVWRMWATQVEMFACDPSNTLSKCKQAQGQSNEKHSEKQSKHYFIL